MHKSLRFHIIIVIKDLNFVHNADFTHLRYKSQKFFTENDLNFIYPLEKIPAKVYNSIMKSYVPTVSADIIYYLYKKETAYGTQKTFGNERHPYNAQNRSPRSERIVHLSCLGRLYRLQNDKQQKL